MKKRSDRAAIGDVRTRISARVNNVTGIPIFAGKWGLTGYVITFAPRTVRSKLRV